MNSESPSPELLFEKQIIIKHFLNGVAKTLGMESRDGQVRITVVSEKGKFKFHSDSIDDNNKFWASVHPEPNSNHSPPVGAQGNLFQRVPLKIDPKYGELDMDTLMFLSHFCEPCSSRILEVGANQEPSSRILSDNGYSILGIDLRPDDYENRWPLNYARLEGDFIQLTPHLVGNFQAIFSTSAVEHFGLGTYGVHDPIRDPDYDSKAMDCMWNLLKNEGSCYITVPYGRRFFAQGDHWRVYDKNALQERIIRKFQVVEKIFFQSAQASCPADEKGIVKEEDANEYEPGDHPHVTVFLKMKKVS